LLGSTRAVVEGTTVVESYDFEPWGLLMPWRTLGSGTKEGFTGKEQDAETGLDYFGARYYLPALGRWTAVDPLAEKHPEWSPYNYVLNNPLVLIDPDGRQVEANLARMYAFRDNVLPKVGPSARAAGDVAAGLTPYVSTAHDVATLVTGRNQITGDEVGLFGRGVALVGVVTPVSGALLRKLLHAGVDRVRRIAKRLGDDAAQRGLRGADTWGNPRTLDDHFARHGSDFGTQNAKEYAQSASDFLQRSQAEGFPTKIAPDGTIRVYDPATNTLGAYNPDGTTKTFFKPRGGADYWERQPGVPPTIIVGQVQ
jgi:RHS repeat-associated protein